MIQNQIHENVTIIKKKYAKLFFLFVLTTSIINGTYKPIMEKITMHHVQEHGCSWRASLHVVTRVQRSSPKTIQDRTWEKGTDPLERPFGTYHGIILH